jgi:hypothetical protein
MVLPDKFAVPEKWASCRSTPAAECDPQSRGVEGEFMILREQRKWFRA